MTLMQISDSGAVKPRAIVSQTEINSENACGASVSIAMHFLKASEIGMLQNYSDGVIITKGMEVREAIFELHKLASRLEKACIFAIGDVKSQINYVTRAGIFILG